MANHGQYITWNVFNARILISYVYAVWMRSYMLIRHWWYHIQIFIENFRTVYGMDMSRKWCNQFVSHGIHLAKRCVCVCERTNWTMKHWSRIRDKHEWITVFCHLVCCVRLPAIRLLSIVDMQTQMKMRLIDYPVCPCHCLFLHEWWSLSQKNRHLVRSAKFSGCHMTLNHAK